MITAAQSIIPALPTAPEDGGHIQGEAGSPNAIKVVAVCARRYWACVEFGALITRLFSVGGAESLFFRVKSTVCPMTMGIHSYKMRSIQAADQPPIAIRRFSLQTLARPTPRSHEDSAFSSGPSPSIGAGAWLVRASLEAGGKIAGARRPCGDGRRPAATVQGWVLHFKRLCDG